MRLEFHPEAEQEFLEAVLHYEMEVPGLGERLDAEVRAATALLLEYPEIGPPIDHGPQLRSASPLKFRGLILCRIDYQMRAVKRAVEESKS